MSKLVARFLRERFEAVVGHREAGQWDKAHSVLSEIETHVEDLEPQTRRACQLWVEIHTHLVEAARLSTTFQPDAELRRIGKARYGIERLLADMLDDPDSEDRLRVERMHADVKFGEVSLALDLGAFRGSQRDEMEQSRDELLATAISKAKDLAMRRLQDRERFEHLPGWIRTAMEETNLGLVVLAVDGTDAANEPATLRARLGGLMALGGDPKMRLKDVFQDPNFLDSFRKSTCAALDRLLEKPAAAELQTWMRTLWDAGLRVDRYEASMTQLRQNVLLGYLECMPEFLALERATHPEHRCRACAKLIAKLADHAYRPALQVLATLAKESAEPRMAIGKLIGDLQGMWRENGPLCLIDIDVVTIRNSESHARTTYEPWGSRVTFANYGRVLGPISREDLECKLDALLDRITTMHLFACYVGHPGDPHSLGRAVGHPSHTEFALPA